MDTIDKIRILMKQQKITQNNIAECCGVHRTTVTYWFKHHDVSSFTKYIPQLAALFDVSSAYLLGDVEDPNDESAKLDPFTYAMYELSPRLDEKTKNAIIKMAQMMQNDINNDNT